MNNIINSVYFVKIGIFKPINEKQEIYSKKKNFIQNVLGNMCRRITYFTRNDETQIHSMV